MHSEHEESEESVTREEAVGESHSEVSLSEDPIGANQPLGSDADDAVSRQSDEAEEEVRYTTTYDDTQRSCKTFEDVVGVFNYHSHQQPPRSLK